MGQEDKNAISVLVRVLGGEYTSKLSKKNSHLITPTAGGDKYEAAVDWNLTLITPDWLIDSALAGAHPACKADRQSAWNNVCVMMKAALLPLLMTSTKMLGWQSSHDYLTACSCTGASTVGTNHLQPICNKLISSDCLALLCMSICQTVG